MSRSQLALAAALWLALTAVTGIAVHRHHLSVDITASGRNSLSAASRELLGTMDKPIRMTAFCAPNAEIRKALTARLDGYRRLRPDLELRIVDPAVEPVLARELGIGAAAELVIEYGGRRENLLEFTEYAISSALQRLAQERIAKVLFVSGHGERDPDSEEQPGYSRFAASLRHKGMNVRRFVLATAAAIPKDADALVLAGPALGLLAGERERLAAFVAAGGNLLWLLDPDTPKIPELETALGIQTAPGTIVYQDYDLLGTAHPALALVAEYPPHPALGGLQDLTVFPVAGGLRLATTQPGWQTRPLLASVERSWLDTGAIEQPPMFTPGADTRGPVLFGAALERQDPHAQRVAVVADSDFLSNAFIDQLANQRLGVALMQWLTRRDAQLSIDVQAAPDARLNLSRGAATLLSLLFVLGIPATLVGVGMAINWRRRRS